MQRPVERGVQVKKGDRLFVIDPVVAQAEVARAEGALAESQSRYENLLKGKRPEEKEVTTAQRRETEAALANAEIEYKRQSELLAKGVGTKKDYDNAESQMRQLRMRQASLAAQEKVNELAARPDEIAAAKAMVDQNQANLDQARKRLDDLMPVAPEDGLIENTFFNVGEWVPAGTPVVSLLPPYRVKLRFFVPEEDAAHRQMGQTGQLHLRRLPAGPQGAHHLRLAARRIHAAGDLLADRARPSWCSWSRRGPDADADAAAAGPAGHRRAPREVNGVPCRSPSTSTAWSSATARARSSTMSSLAHRAGPHLRLPRPQRLGQDHDACA